MAWWERRERGRYQIGWREPDGRKRRQTFGDFDTAHLFKTDLEARLARGDYVPVEQRKLPLGTYMDNVLAGGDISRSTLDAYAYRRKHTRDLEQRPIGEVTPSDIRALMASLEEDDVGPAARASVRKLLSKVFRVAVAEGILARNPCASVPVPRIERREIHIFTVQELDALGKAMPPHLWAAVPLSAYTGLRGGEVGGLRDQDIAWLPRQIHVTQTVQRSRGHAVIGPPKTAASRRVVAVPGFVIEVLALHIRKFGLAPDGRLFRTRGGGYIGSQELGDAFRRALEECGLEGRWHDLRHTSVAFAIQLGAHPKQIQARLGHSSITTTLDTYGHLFPGLDDELASRMDDAFSQTQKAAPPEGGRVRHAWGRVQA
jgi:integrase